MTHIASTLKLSNGVVLKNRFAKAAMSEQLGTRENAPNERIAKLFGTWAEGGTALLMTGNVMIDRHALGEAGNVVLTEDCDLEPFRAWAKQSHVAGTQTWMQLNHPGRQTPRSVTKKPVAPSPVPMKGFAGVFAPPRALTGHEIEQIIGRFATSAKLAVEAGFSGVQIHGAHGYLVSQFLSPRTNQREDDWGGTPEKRRRFLTEVIRAMRKAIGPSKGLGLKLNSADFMRGGFSEEESMDVVKHLEHVDVLEISGGTYERSPWGAGAKTQRASTVAREAYFLDYASRVRQYAKMPLMLTGGFRSAEAMNEALASGAIDLIGLARPLAVEPDLPNRLIAGSAKRAIEVDLASGIKRIDDFLEVAWYQQQLQRMGDGKAPDPASCRSVAFVKGLVQAFTHRPRPPAQLKPATKKANEPALTG